MKKMEIKESNQLLIFSNEEFGNIRTVIIDGEPWFCGKDVAGNLGYVNEKNAVKRHCDEGEVLKRTLGVQTGIKKDGTPAMMDVEMFFVNESGLYSLIFGSKLESAKRFKRWITSEVLPTLRKTGRYEMPNQKLSNEEIMKIQLGMIERQEKQICQIDSRLNNLEKRLDVVGAFDNDWMLHKIQDTAKFRVCNLTSNPVHNVLWRHYFFSGIYATLKKIYKISTLRSIPSDALDETIEIINSWEPSNIFLHLCKPLWRNWKTHWI